MARRCGGLLLTAHVTVALAFLPVNQPASASARMRVGPTRLKATAGERPTKARLLKARTVLPPVAAPVAPVAPVATPAAAPAAMAPAAVKPITLAPTTVAPITVAPAALAATRIDPARFQRLQAALDAWTRTASGVESITVAMHIDGYTWEAGSRPDSGPSPDAGARYRTMSITKTVTAALVLRAVDNGKLNLDAPLPRIDGVPTAVPDGINVRRLLAHRSGLADYTEATGYRADQPMTPQQAVELSLHAPPVSAPGTTTRYVNSNYLLLGLLLQQVHQRSFADLVADLTGPLGLVNTSVEPPDRPGWAGFSSGGIMSTVGDMARWGDALFTPGWVVTAGSLKLMATTGDLEGGLGLWGVCPCTDRAPGGDRFTAIGHFTAAGGMFRFPRAGMTLVMKAEPAGGDTITRAVSLSRVLIDELTG